MTISKSKVKIYWLIRWLNVQFSAASTSVLLTSQPRACTLSTLLLALKKTPPTWSSPSRYVWWLSQCESNLIFAAQNRDVQCRVWHQKLLVHWSISTAHHLLLVVCYSPRVVRCLGSRDQAQLVRARFNYYLKIIHTLCCPGLQSTSFTCWWLRCLSSRLWPCCGNQ